MIERIAPDELSEESKYNSLVRQAERMLPEDSHLGYIPASDEADYEWSDFGADSSNVKRLTIDELGDQLTSGTDKVAVVALSRGHIRVDPSPDDPRRNIALTQTSLTNTEQAVTTWRTLAEAAPNRDIVLIPSGRAHIANLGVFRRLQKAFEVPDTSEGAEDGAVIGDATGYKLAAEAEVNGLTLSDFTEFLDRKTANFDTERRQLFARAVFGNHATADDFEAAKEQMIADFSMYPQISEAELMREQAEAAGVPPEAIEPEIDSWDTITQLVWLRDWAERNDSHDVVVVVGEDQLPRVAVYIAKIFSGTGKRVTLVGSDPRLDAGEFPDTFTREGRTLKTGSEWLDEVLDDNPPTHELMRRLYNHPEYDNPPLKNVGYRAYMLSQRQRDAQDHGVR